MCKSLVGRAVCRASSLVKSSNSNYPAIKISSAPGLCKALLIRASSNLWRSLQSGTPVPPTSPTPNVPPRRHLLPADLCRRPQVLPRRRLPQRRPWRPRRAAAPQRLRRCRRRVPALAPPAEPPRAAPRRRAPSRARKPWSRHRWLRRRARRRRRPRLRCTSPLARPSSSGSCAAIGSASGTRAPEPPQLPATSSAATGRAAGARAPEPRRSGGSRRGWRPHACRRGACCGSPPASSSDPRPPPPRPHGTPCSCRVLVLAR
mmetsp:Transcript_146797/g.471301  ORF Transcript_146797/g.471301 Transcript_146797/m.471301 type:complete len:261 (+) Transcript_146797:130-912(+)